MYSLPWKLLGVCKKMLYDYSLTMHISELLFKHNILALQHQIKQQASAHQP